MYTSCTEQYLKQTVMH